MMRRIFLPPLWSRELSPAALLTLFLLGLGGQILSSALFSHLLSVLFPQMEQMAVVWLAVLLSEVLGIVFLLAAWRNLLPGKIPDMRPMDKRMWKLTFAAFIIAVTGSGVLGGFWQSFLDLTGIPYSDEQDVTEMFRSSSLYGKLLIGFTAVLIVPFFEELLFRRTLYALFVRWGNVAAIVLASLIFGAAHGFLLGTPSLCWIGLVFQVFYLYSRNIWVSTAAHAILNFTALLGVLLQIIFPNFA